MKRRPLAVLFPGWIYQAAPTWVFEMLGLLDRCDYPRRDAYQLDASTWVVHSVSRLS